MQSTLTMFGVALGMWLVGVVMHDDRLLFSALVVAMSAVVNFLLRAACSFIARSLKAPGNGDSNG